MGRAMPWLINAVGTAVRPLPSWLNSVARGCIIDARGVFAGRLPAMNNTVSARCELR
jgi:hypothetical protein